MPTGSAAGYAHALEGERLSVRAAHPGDRAAIDAFVDAPRSQFLCFASLRPAGLALHHPGEGPAAVAFTDQGDLIAAAWTEPGARATEAVLTVAVERNQRARAAVAPLLRALCSDLNAKGVSRIVTTVPFDVDAAGRLFRAAGLTVDSCCGFGGVAELVLRFETIENGLHSGVAGAA